MLLMMECVIACALFALVVLWDAIQRTYKIYYVLSAGNTEKGGVAAAVQRLHSSDRKETYDKKTAAVLLFIVVLAAVAYVSGARTFQTAFGLHLFYSRRLTFSNALVLDIGIFCHSRKLRIPGTEDMDKAYRDYAFHIVGAVKGLALGVMLSLFLRGVVHAMAGMGR